jgi:SHAQKYF class myb-like DNA-binding protein
MDPTAMDENNVEKVSTSKDAEVTAANNVISTVPPGDSNAEVPSAVLSSTVPAPVADPSRAVIKNKKKKGHSQIPVSSNATSGGGSVGNQGENTGRWTAEEHRLFLQGLEQHGKGWKKIASLIKSRTVVQIRTHAQKYFQKLAKARQNGEDEGAVTFMEGRGGTASTTSASTIIPRRRRQVTGTKRKSIQSLFASVQRQGKKIATATPGAPNPSSAISVAPALKFFVVPSSSTITDTSDEAIPSGPVLEDSMYVELFLRFLYFCVMLELTISKKFTTLDSAF